MKKEGHSCTHCGNEDICFMGRCKDCILKMMQKLEDLTFPEKWEKEWKDTAWVFYAEHDTIPKLVEEHLPSLFEKYLEVGEDEEEPNVTIKARKGAILIERIEEGKEDGKT